MKNKKKIFATLIGVAITSQMLPSTYTISANAQIISDVKEESQDIANDQITNAVKEESQDSTNNSNKQQNGLSNNVIRLYGVGCEETSDEKGHPGYHEFQISFKNNKLKTTVKSGYPDDETHPFHPSFQNEYIKVTLLDADGNIKEELSLKGNDNVSKALELDKWDFVYGDRLRIKHEEADWRTIIEGKVTDSQGQAVTGLNNRISKEDLNNYDFKITESGLQKVKAFTNELNKTKITLAGAGCQEGIHSFEVTLDPKTKKFGVKIISGLGYTGTHPFHPYFEGEYIRMTLLDKDGNIKEDVSLKGTENVSIVQKLNEWHFEYGDRLRIRHAEADWRTKIDGNVTNAQGETITGLNNGTSKDVLNKYDFEITKSGLHEVEAFTNELSKTKITLSGVGCQEGTHGFEVTLDPKTKKFGVKIICGLGYTGTHPFHPSFEGEYIRIALIGNDGNIKNDFTMTGNENVGKVEKELSKWEFEYGDRLRIFHEQAGWRTKIAGNVTDTQGETITVLNNGTSKDVLNNYDFEITKSGLQEIEKKIVEVSDADQLIEKLKDKTQKIIKLKQDITFTNEDVSKFENGVNDSKELIIGKGVSIEGDNHFIDFNGLGSLTLKGDNIRLSNVTIKGCSNIGMQVYNSKQVYLKNVTVSDAKRYGLFVNASNVILENCTTRNNIEGGIFISRSMALQDDNKYTDSEVKVIGRLNQEGENSPKVIIKNLEMLNGNMQNNTFIPVGSQCYNESRSDKTVTLSKFYCDLLEIPEDKQIREITLKYN